jgi:2-methylcitrate dehydratase PrpD
VPKGDPGNPLSDAELENKFSRLAALHEALDSGRCARLVDTSWSLDRLEDVGAELRIPG